MYKKCKMILFISIFLFAIMSAVFLILPLGNELPNGTSSISIITGVLFWGGFIMGCVMQFVLMIQYRKLVGIGKGQKTEKMGLISFFKNKIATIFDLLFVISLISLIVEKIWTDMTLYVCFVSLSLLIFSFIMHCILNGKIFRYIFKK